MNKNISIKNKSGETIFQLTADELKKVNQQEKSGEHLYLLEYDYAQDLLLHNKDADEVINELKGLCYIIDQKSNVEEIYLFVSTVMKADMIEACAGIDYGTILELDQEGNTISNLRHDVEHFSAIDENELADIELEIQAGENDAAGEYGDAVDLFIKTTKEHGSESYGRKDVIKKREEEEKDQ